MHQGGVDVCRRTGCFWISRRGSSARYSEHCICSSLYVANLRHLLERVFPCSMGHVVVVCLDMCRVDVRFWCVFGGPERSVAPQFCGNSPPRFLSCRGPPASRRRQPRVRPSHIEPHPMLRALQIQARPFLSTRTAAARHQFVPISVGTRHFTTRSPNKMSDIAPQIPPESAAATTVTAAPPTSSADKQKKQQHPHANANANAKQKPKAPPKKEVRILMLHGLFTPPSYLVSGQL